MLNDEQLYCQIRKEWIAATPEEQVRQFLLYRMIYSLGFPASGIALEKSLKQMPHLSLSPIKLPTRRADIVFFGKDIHSHYGLYPLLLVECKAIKLNAKALNQALGYNHYLKAYFVAVANQSHIKTAWYDSSIQDYRFFDDLPSFTQLMECIHIK